MEILGLALVVFAVVFVVLTIRIVPQQSVFVVERLGKYNRTLEAGMHVMVPFVDRVAYKTDLKEMVLDISYFMSNN